MKKLKAIFGSLLAAALMVGCSDQLDPDSQKNQLTGEDGEGYYMGLDIQMPTGNLSRSQTNSDGGSTDGTEVGSDAENTVSNALIVLAERNSHNFIAAGEVASNRLTAMTSATQASYKAVAKISKTALNDFYDGLSGDGEPIVEVFVFCNPTKWLVDKMVNWKPTDDEKGEWVDWYAEVYQGQSANGQPDYNVGIWSPNSFLMNNVETTTRALPKNILDWELFDKVENPFHLSEKNTAKDGLPDNYTGRGPVRVERSVARFDFKDGSAKGDQVYNVLFQADPDAPDDETKRIPIVAVKLQKMCLVNMSNSFYFLPRVSNSGFNTTQAGARPDGWSLCGLEKPWGRDGSGKYNNGNYVVDFYAAQYRALATNWNNPAAVNGTPTSNNPYTYFNFPFFDENGSFNNGLEAKNQWDSYDIATVLAGTNKDNYKGKSEYTVWRYVTENAIPAPEGNQINALSTGIVFRARLQGTEKALAGDVNEESWEEDVYKNLALCLDGEPFQLHRTDHPAISGVDNKGVSTDPILYYLDGKLYFTWEHLRQAAIQASVTPTWEGEDKIASVEINRSNSLYRAVFGDGPIPAGMKYIKDGEKGQANAYDFTDPRWDADVSSAEYKLYAQSCDYAWSEWNKTKYVGTISGYNDPEMMKPIEAMRAVMTDAGIAIYQSSLDPTSTPGYYCYYYYWNRHNDNKLAGVMGPMEFDVIRNNVYKLSVTNISRLGHPRIPENDPDKPTPTTPDESANIYMDVIVEIADWAVRLNSIVF